MHQRDLVKRAWADAGLYETKDAKLRQFLEHVDAAGTDCWPELIAECRARYPEYKAALVAPLWKAGDKLVRLNVIRAVDVGQEDEVAIVHDFVKRSHPEQDEHELRAVVHLRHAPLTAAVASKPGLPHRLRAIAGAPVKKRAHARK